MEKKRNILYLPGTIEKNRQIKDLVQNARDLIEAAMGENDGFSLNLELAVGAMRQVIDEVEGNCPEIDPDDVDYSDPNAEHRLTGKQMGVL